MSLIELLSMFTRDIQNGVSRSDARYHLWNYGVEPEVIDAIDATVVAGGRWIRADKSLFPVTSTAQ